jgi:hypothetical protein
VVGLLGAVAIVVILLVTESSHGTSGSLTTVAGCESAFSIPPSPATPRGPTPASALTIFLRSGSIDGAAPPFRSPLTAGYPAVGWHRISHDPRSAVFASGKNLLTVEPVPGGLWQVEGGLLCRQP